jgi:hypothetical protein
MVSLSDTILQLASSEKLLEATNRKSNQALFVCRCTACSSYAILRSSSNQHFCPEKGTSYLGAKDNDVNYKLVLFPIELWRFDFLQTELDQTLVLLGEAITVRREGNNVSSIIIASDDDSSWEDVQQRLYDMVIKRHRAELLLKAAGSEETLETDMLLPSIYRSWAHPSPRLRLDSRSNPYWSISGKCLMYKWTSIVFRYVCYSGQGGSLGVYYISKGILLLYWSAGIISIVVFYR